MMANNSFLEYLDKEMTIMGILSTFCVASVALVLDRIGGAEPTKNTLFSQIWCKEHSYVLLGTALTAAAGALFYMQRSAIAWYYGQITLSIESPKLNGISTDEWYRDADSWATWIPYQSAFTSLCIGAGFFLLALLQVSGTLMVPVWVVWSVLVVSVVVQAVRLKIYQRHKYDDDPIGMVFPLFRSR